MAPDDLSVRVRIDRLPPIKADGHIGDADGGADTSQGTDLYLALYSGLGHEGSHVSPHAQLPLNDALLHRQETRTVGSTKVAEMPG